MARQPPLGCGAENERLFDRLADGAFARLQAFATGSFRAAQFTVDHQPIEAINNPSSGPCYPQIAVTRKWREKMWALGFLLVILVYFLFIGVVSRLLPASYGLYLKLAAVGIPLSFPFWHFLYPSYHEFLQLCSRDDRYVVAKTETVDFVYSDSGCYHGFKTIEGTSFLGYECEHWRGQTPDSYPRTKRLYRFTRAENFDSASCENACKSPSLSEWEKHCQNGCFIGTEIHEPSFKYESTYTSTGIVGDKLIRIRQAKVAPNGEDMAILLDYVYYPFGNGWATILGLSSGSAPTQSCEKKFDIYRYDFLKPISRQ